MERDKTPETANDVYSASIFHTQYPVAISPAPPPVGTTDIENNAPPDGTASTNTHSNAKTSSRQGSEPTLMLDADRGEAVVADRQSARWRGLSNDRMAENNLSLLLLHLCPVLPRHSDTEQNIPRCGYNLRPREKKIVKL
ncbi:unnamed protein product [Parnassius apollo]|uniref:(apollo) hypothetical protein n=1 Tax=Parnassius apollo TaxID=110799 RepID=A0A8S3W150_PARAO|nr:unnamed protein product [Parnassius apollo]